MLRQRQNVRPESEAAEPAGRMSSEDRRLHLIKVAIRLFSQKGFSGTTTREIAVAAGVNEAIIFRHFATKDELYAAILDSKARQSPIDDLLDHLQSYVPGRDDRGMFSYLAANILAHHRQDQDFLRLMLYSALENHELARRFLDAQTGPLEEFLCKYVVKRQREGAFRRCNPVMAVQAFLGMTAHYSLVGLLFGLNPKSVSDEAAVDAFASLMLDGLRRKPSYSKDVKKSGKKKNG
jgi:TetR/AcrR family transcriptional regulator